MLLRISAVAMNTYREAVRARMLHGLMGLAIGTTGYSLVVGAYALRNENKVVSDLGAASISLYAIVVAIILAATSLYRELELKTLFPILGRPIERWEYLLGKYLGIILTLAVFMGLNCGLLLFAIGALEERPLALALQIPLAIILVASIWGWKVARFRSWLPIPVSLVLLVVGGWFASGAVAESSVVLGQTLLSLLEVCIVTALAMVFASFSSPFLTAVFSLCVFLIGRSAGTLAKLPENLFGQLIHDLGAGAARVVPNLMVYVPARPLLAGEAVGVTYWPYAGWAALQALAWCVGLLAFASFIFKKRDFL